jgi:hypothetical protein
MLCKILRVHGMMQPMAKILFALADVRDHDRRSRAGDDRQQHCDDRPSHRLAKSKCPSLATSSFCNSAKARLRSLNCKAHAS